MTGYVRRFWQVGSRVRRAEQTLSNTGEVRCLAVWHIFSIDNGDSEDHRGTPEAPGRVVTLIERSFWSTLKDPHPSGSEKVWGTAYRIEADKVAEVREYLDIREINGYTIHYTSFYPADGGETIKTLVWICGESTPLYSQCLFSQLCYKDNS